MKKFKYPSVLTVAGFDGSGGAGIQGDMKAISALGCFATSVLTALPVQNTCGVKTIHSIPTQIVDLQLATILEDILPDAIKIGMVHHTELVETISAALKKHPHIPVVFDPVMIATSGDRLIEESTIQSIITSLFPLSSLITPNLDEASLLAGMKIETVDDMHRAGAKILGLGCKAVLIKGGHLNTKILTSLLFEQQGKVHSYESQRIHTDNVHGSGCTLSSAIASYLAQGKSMHESVMLGQDYVQNAIRHAADVKTGKCNGPLNHFFNPQKLIKYEMV